jgi:DNA-binding protein HU-beta
MRAVRGFHRAPGHKISQKPGFPEKCQGKPQKTCGNAGFAIDKRRWKPHGKGRQVISEPRQYWLLRRLRGPGECSGRLTPATSKKTRKHKEEYSMAATLTKTALVRQLAEKLEITNKQSAAFLDLLADTAIKETKKNGVFVIPGLGRLVKAERKARLGRNPQTGEQIKIKAKTVVKFRVAKSAKDTIAPPKK